MKINSRLAKLERQRQPEDEPTKFLYYDDLSPEERAEYDSTAVLWIKENRQLTAVNVRFDGP